MARKLTYKLIKSEFEKRNYTLLEEKYINARTKMNYICDKGHKTNIIYSNFQKGQGCKLCFLNNQKLDHNFIKQEFEKRGYTLLEKKYAGCMKKMKFKCNKGHEGYITYRNFQQGHGCVKCSAERTKLTFEFVKSKFKERNYQLLETKYINAHTKMNYKCLECNSINCIIYNKLQQGKGCPNCAKEKMKGINNPMWNPNREYVKINKLIRKRIEGILKHSLKCINKNKNNNSYKILGFTSKQLLEHLESFPNWNDLKDQNWHLDHKLPIKAFIENGITDLKIINHLSNLQPLLAKDNLKKSDKYDIYEFNNYLNSENIIKIKEKKVK